MTYADSSEKVKLAGIDRVGIAAIVTVVMAAIYFFQQQNNNQDGKQWERISQHEARMTTIEKNQLETGTLLKILTANTTEFIAEQKVVNREVSSGIRNIERSLDKQEKAIP